MRRGKLLNAGPAGPAAAMMAFSFSLCTGGHAPPPSAATATTTATATAAATTERTATPADAAATSYPAEVAAGRTHACAIVDNVAYCWGSNLNGWLGCGELPTPPICLSVYSSGGVPGAADNSGMTQIGAGDETACAMEDEDFVYCWGADSQSENLKPYEYPGNPAPAWVQPAMAGLGAVLRPDVLPPDVPRPGPPGKVTYTLKGTTATIGWAEPDVNPGSVTSYTVYDQYGAAAGCEDIQADTCEIPGLTAGETYTIRVVANAGANSAATQSSVPSSSVTFTIPQGILSITDQLSNPEPKAAAQGGEAVESLGDVTVVDSRGPAGTWVAAAGSTDFTDSGSPTIPAREITYTTGGFRDVTGSKPRGVVSKAFPGAAGAIGPSRTSDIGTAGNYMRVATGTGVPEATWDPTISMRIPNTAVPGTRYTGIIYHSVL
jgi:hypothetical protein